MLTAFWFEVCMLLKLGVKLNSKLFEFRSVLWWEKVFVTVVAALFGGWVSGLGYDGAWYLGRDWICDWVWVEDCCEG